jgi:hypothetical protein
LKRRDFVSSGIFSYSTGIFLGKYPGNGGKAEKNEELVKNTPFINQSEDSILI